VQDVLDSNPDEALRALRGWIEDTNAPKT